MSIKISYYSSSPHIYPSFSKSLSLSHNQDKFLTKSHLFLHFQQANTWISEVSHFLNYFFVQLSMIFGLRSSSPNLNFQGFMVEFEVSIKLCFGKTHRCTYKLFDLAFGFNRNQFHIFPQNVTMAEFSFMLREEFILFS